KQELSSLEDTTVLGSFPPLSTPITTLAGNAPGKSSYANVTGKPSGKKLNIHTLFTPRSNGIDVVVSVESIRAIIMIELQADVELKDSIIVDMPKIIGESHYICNFRVEYECKPPRCVSCNVFGHIHEECPKNTSAGEKKTLKKPSQTSRGVLVGLKMGFKPQKEYSAIPKKTYSLALCGNKKKGVGVSTSTTPIIDKIEKFEELLTSGKDTLVEKLKGSYWHSKFAENNGGIRNGK
ncbi:hypothetical protein Tco_0784918, partial [Tanacetum coccineum]